MCACSLARSLPRARQSGCSVPVCLALSSQVVPLHRCDLPVTGMPRSAPGDLGTVPKYTFYGAYGLRCFPRVRMLTLVLATFRPALGRQKLIDGGGTRP